MHAHALDITTFILSVTVRVMTNDVFTKDDLLGRLDLSLGGITPASQIATSTSNQHISSACALATYTGQVS